MSTSRLAWRPAGAVFAAVLAVYLGTLAPSVTWWDAGEFIAAAKTLGIPHPPGTPLFVALAHVWGLLVPVGEFAFRTNLLSAVFGALAAAGFFLILHDALDDVWTAAAAALIGATTWTTWQNSNETEVYAVATAMAAWGGIAMLRWRAHRASGDGTRYLLLAGYLLGLSVSVHLLAMLAGPALVAFGVVTSRTAPLPDAGARRREHAELAVLAGLWALLVGTGLGSTTLLGVGGAAFAVAAAFAIAAGRGSVVAVALLLAVLGVSPYALLYLRAQQMPPINEADPSTWDALLAVIRRAQYPVRTPFDDPTQYHGPENPGRSLLIIGLQLLNYLQYFDWQWAKALPVVPARVLVSIAAFWIGWRGQGVLRRRDAGIWTLLGVLWLVTGLGLVAYMNFKPGASLGWPQFPEPGQHEVRERDYFFLVSFAVWGLFVGIGAADLAARLRGHAPRLVLAGAVLVPLLGNWTAATRRGPDAALPRDVAYDLLNSMPPHGILFTYGDNDTFPLWWAQEVEGVRPDVTVVCIALANTEWYMRQLRDRPARPFDPAMAPVPWRAAGAVPTPTTRLHDLTDQEIALAAQTASFTDRATTVDFGPFTHAIPAQTLIEPSDVVTLRILRANLGRRPIAWSVTTGGPPLGLGIRTVQQGLVYRLDPTLPDLADPRFHRSAMGGPLLDVPLTDTLAWQTYRYADLAGAIGLETTSSAFAGSLAIPFTQLATAYTARGDSARAVRNLGRAAAIGDDPGLRQAYQSLR